MAADVIAFIEQVEVEESCYKEPQPLVTLCAIRPALPYQKRLRLWDVETKSLSLQEYLNGSACNCFYWAG